MDGNGADHEAEHVHDFVQRPELDEAVAQSRVRYPWIILWTVYALLLVKALADSFGGTYEKEAKAFEWDTVLKQEVRLEALRSSAPGDQTDLGRQMVQYLGSDTTPEDFRAQASKDRMAAAYDTVLRFERGEKPKEKELKFLEGSDKPYTRAMAKIYRAETLTPQQAKALTSGLPKGLFIYDLIRAHAYQKAGDESLHAKLARPQNMLALAAAMLMGCGVLALGVVFWILYLSLRSSDYLRPLGHPVAPITPGQADRLALRGVQLLALYLVIGLTAAAFFQKSSLVAQSLVQVGLALVLLPLAFRIPLLGWKPTLADVGLNLRNFGKNLLWGVGGYVAMVPILLITIAMALGLSKVFPKPYHPIGMEILTTKDPWLIVGIFLLASVLAPFAEELIFRGCLFPAISRASNSLVIGAVASSLMFASIHPQGMAAWPVLFAIALLNCGLAHQTKSLVPCMVVHAIHNGLALAVSLMMR